MSEYKHLGSGERDQIAQLKAEGLSNKAIAEAIGRDPSTISRELRRNSQDSGAYRPTYAVGSYLYRRQRPALLERDERLRRYVVDRLSEGWTPEQIAGRLKRGIERGLQAISFETIYAWIYSKARKAEKLWRYLPRRRATRRPMKRRWAKDRITDKVHISQRSEAANAREEAGHWEGDLVICKKSRPVLVLHERKTKITFITRQMGKTAAETASAIMAVFKRLNPDYAALRYLRQWWRVRAARSAGRLALGDNILLRCLCLVAKGRCREYQRAIATMDPPQHRPRRDDRAGHSGHRHDNQHNAAKVPRLQITNRGLPRRAWQEHRYPLQCTRCTSLVNPPGRYRRLSPRRIENLL